MDKELIILIVQVVVLIGSFLFGKYIMPNLSKETIQAIAAKIDIVIKYADKFVHWASYFMKDANGSQKMEEVVKQLKQIAKRYGLDIPEAELTAIAQTAYDTMKAGQKAAENEQTKAEAAKLSAINTAVIAPVVLEATTNTTASSETQEPPV